MPTDRARNTRAALWLRRHAAAVTGALQIVKGVAAAVPYAWRKRSQVRFTRDGASRAYPATDGPEPWGTVHEQRTVHLRGPGTMRETLVAVDRPHAFAYELGRITGPLALLVTSVRGRWSCEPAGTGTRVTWTWDVTPRPAARPLMPAFARLWQGYARLALAELEAYLLKPATA